MNPETERVVAFLQEPAGVELLTMVFLPDVGGDPEDYDIDDAANADENQLASALGIFMETAASAGLLEPGLVKAVTSGVVDWPTAWSAAATEIF